MDQSSGDRVTVNHDRYPDEYLRGILNEVRTIAVVGASNKDVRPSYFVMKYLQGKGYRMIPVNPGLAGQEILGETVYASLTDVPVPIDMVDIFRNSAAAAGIVDEALALPVRPKAVWMQFNVRNDDAARKAEAAGIRVVMNRCPKVEWARLNGELVWQGFDSRVISSKRRKL